MKEANVWREEEDEDGNEKEDDKIHMKRKEKRVPTGGKVVCETVCERI